VSADQLQQALLKFDTDSLILTSPTLQQWLQRMQEIYVVDERLAVVVQKLERVLYGADASDKGAAALAHEAFQILRKLSPKKSAGIKVTVERLVKPI
jgi:hypothetical protein